MRYWLCLFAALALLCLPAGAVELPKELTDALPSQAERLLEAYNTYTAGVQRYALEKFEESFGFYRELDRQENVD